MPNRAWDTAPMLNRVSGRIMSYKINLAKIFLVASGLCLLQPDAAQAQKGSSRETNTKLTASQFMDLPVRTQTKIIEAKFFALLVNLSSDTYRGKPKPPAMKEAHAEIYSILYDHFFNPNKNVKDGELGPFDKLGLAFLDANPNTDFDAVFRAHIRKVIRDYEQAKKAENEPKLEGH